MSCIDVMLVDDHVLIREGIKQLLEFDKSIKVVDEASDGDECLSKLTKTSAQVLLLDINMPKKNGLDVLEEIKAKKLNIKVLILTVHDEIEYLLKAVDIGVDGYILKDSEIKELKTYLEEPEGKMSKESKTIRENFQIFGVATFLFACFGFFPETLFQETEASNTPGEDCLTTFSISRSSLFFSFRLRV